MEEDNEELEPTTGGGDWNFRILGLTGLGCEEAAGAEKTPGDKEALNGEEASGLLAGLRGAGGTAVAAATVAAVANPWRGGMGARCLAGSCAW